MDSNRTTSISNKCYALIYNHPNSEWIEFKNPIDIFQANSLSEVIPSLQKMESFVRNKSLYSAGFISYESAPAFDPAFCAKQLINEDFPYLVFGLFEHAKVVRLSEKMGYANNLSSLKWISSITRAEYESNINKIKQHILNGNTYQVNYTFRLHSAFNADPFSFFCSIVGDDPPPYSCFFQAGNFAICSFSPELFFELYGTNIKCRPMKGTHIRGRTTEEDELFRQKLYNCPKNRSENIMIVDMIRNDISRIAQPGTVRVENLFEIERYRTIFQMTSTISGKTSASLTEIFKALFPCASITGAPKVRTMEIIDKTETLPRKIYTGAIGYLTPVRKAVFNVAIRTVLVNTISQKGEYGVGSGIINGSDVEDEYNESLLKATTVSEPHVDFQLFETMLWTPRSGYFLLALHLDRMINSALYFDYKADRQAIAGYLKEISSLFPPSPQRVRINLHRNGILTHSIQAAPDKTPSIIKLRLARSAIDPTNRLLYHKTSLREVYENAQNSFSDNDDVVLFNEKNEITETTVANIVVEINDKLVTPPICCGLLPGVMRKHLLDSNLVIENRVTINDLLKATKIYRINSVRKWEPSELLK